MISQRLAKAFTKFAWIDEHYDPICSIPLTKALCAVVEAAEFCTNNWCIKDHCHCAICAAMKELERALKEVGI